MVLKSTEGRTRSPIKSMIYNFASFPSTVMEALKGIDEISMSKTYIAKDEKFNEVNLLEKDLFAINSNWDNLNEVWRFELFNLLNDSTLHYWELDEDFLQLEDFQEFRNLRPKHAILLDSLNLIVKFRQTPNLMRIDRSGKLKWKNNKYSFHHSMNLDADGYLWVCAAKVASNSVNNRRWWMNPTAKIKNPDGTTVAYEDDLITKVDVISGEVVFSKSVSELLRLKTRTTAFTEILYSTGRFETFRSKWGT